MEKLKVIFEDNHIIVVEKPVNIPSQADKTGDIDMLTIIKEYIKELGYDTTMFTNPVNNTECDNEQTGITIIITGDTFSSSFSSSCK